MISFEIQDAELQRALRRVLSSVDNPQPLLHDIGQILKESTMRRFETSTAPDSSRWAKNAESTMRRHPGKLKKPLIGETGNGGLGFTIDYQTSSDSVSVGSNKPYAAMMHFGGKKSQFKNLWGDIPARPFLGISDSDAGSILDKVADFLSP